MRWSRMTGETAAGRCQHAQQLLKIPRTRWVTFANSRYTRDVRRDEIASKATHFASFAMARPWPGLTSTNNEDHVSACSSTREYTSRTSEVCKFNANTS